MAVAKKRATSETASVRTADPQFSKEQIVASTKYRNYRDLVDALLDDKKKYTFEVVDKMIENYKKGQVE